MFRRLRLLFCVVAFNDGEQPHDSEKKNERENTGKLRQQRKCHLHIFRVNLNCKILIRKSKPRENNVILTKIFPFVCFAHIREMELQLYFPSSLSNSYCSSSDEGNGSFEEDNVDEELIEDSPRPSSIALFMIYRQFRDVLDLMDSSERLTPIIEEPEHENWLSSVDASSPLIVTHPSEGSPQHSPKAFYTGAVTSHSSLRTLSGSSTIAKSSGTCCFVWLKTIIKWKSRRTKKFE